MIRRMTGWLFDVYPNHHGVTLWLIDEGGLKYRLTRKFTPSFFLQLNEPDRRRAERLALQCPGGVSITRTTRRELFSNMELDVLQIHVHNPLKFRETVSLYERLFPHFAFYTSDILPAQLFLYETDLFPLAFGEYSADETGELREWTLHDTKEAFEYTLPPLSVMMLKSVNSVVPPKYQRTLQLEISYEDRSYVLEQESPVEVLESLNWHLHRFDPDVLLTEYGDSALLPKLTSLAQRCRVPLLFNRDNERGYSVSKESSFFQYGKVIHKDGAFELRGRWHVDAENSFTLAEADLEGLFELVRVTQLCPQHQARASIGTGLSSLQLSWAHRNHILIPSKKREPEEFKPASTLLMSDRGGLIYQPPLGFHEHIAELDFVSMYPSIMVNENVSPETVNCRCCKNQRVPELGYTICEKRQGIIPATLRSVIAKRAYYKKKKKEFKGKNETLYRRYDRRQNSLKWMLVSCFGYLGYKNARFGKIEAHEAVNAFSREAILTAKEIAEEQGYELVHAIIDCEWLKKEGATEADYERLCRDIAAVVGIDISLEGMYEWILFPASKMDALAPTATRYAGVYRNGDSKIRGIEARRRDTPKFIKTMQAALLDQMFHAHTIQELHEILPAILDTARGYVAIIQSGKVNPMELVLRRHVTKEAEEYMNNSISAVVTKLLEETGMHVAAGEMIEYIIIDQTGKKKPEKAKPVALYAFEDGYDIEKYTDMAVEAIATLLEPLGYTTEELRKYFGIGKVKGVKKLIQKIVMPEFDFG